jgi:hypothetical protein
MGFTDWTAPVQKGTAPQGQARSVRKIATASYTRSGSDRGPLVAAAAIAGGAVLVAGTAVALGRRAKRRRTVRRPPASAGPRA